MEVIKTFVYYMSDPVIFVIADHDSKNIVASYIFIFINMCPYQSGMFPYFFQFLELAF